jgi:hypothetical protein
MAKSKLSASDRERIIARYLAGEGTMALAREHNVTHGAIGQLLRRSGIKLRPTPNHKRYSDKELEQARRDYRAWWHANTDVAFGTCWCGCGKETPIATYRETRSGIPYVVGAPVRFVKGHRPRREDSDYYTVEDHGYETPCWIWQLSRHNFGYGFLRGGSAPRQFYEKYRGAIPPGLHIDHLCRVPPCVRPSHLEPVTQAENARRGRNTRLHASQVREVRRLYAEGLLQREIAERFGISVAYVSQLVNEQRWKL